MNNYTTNNNDTFTYIYFGIIYALIGISILIGVNGIYKSYKFRSQKKELLLNT